MSHPKSDPASDPYIAYTHRFFDTWVPVYDLFARSITPAYRAAVRAVDPMPGRTVLDICTGTGEIALRCARRGATVTGIDVTPSMLAKARKKAGDLPVTFELMDARRLQFPDAAFEVVVISFALHDMPRGVRLEVLREAARVTRGQLVVLDYDLPDRPFLRRLWTLSIDLFESAYFNGFAKRGVPEHLHEVGLETFDIRRLRPWPFAVYVVEG